MSSCFGFRKETSVIWALISDGKQALIFKYHKDKMVVHVREIRIKTACNKHLEYERTGLPKTRENSEDRNHRINSVQPSLRIGEITLAHKVFDSSFGSRGDVVNHFILTVAAKLNQAHGDNGFDYLVMVAPRVTLSELHGSLNDGVRTRTLANMPEGYDYDKTGAHYALRGKAPANFGSEDDEDCLESLDKKTHLAWMDVAPQAHERFMSKQ